LSGIVALASCTFPTPPAGSPAPHIDVAFSKTPARGITTVTVNVVNLTVTQVTVALDSVNAPPVASSTMASFQFDLDTVGLLDGPHTLLIAGEGPAGFTANLFHFSSDNSPTTLPSGFQQSTVFNGLTLPTAIRFSPDGQVFVAEKSGIIKVFASLAATTPTVFADLSNEVYSAYDRGLLGLALDPAFPAKPYVYVLYTLDAPIGGTPPVWNDSCPTPPGPNVDGCVVGARLARLQANGGVMTGPEQVLVEDWCQQFSSHSIGTIIFGADGALYAGGGDASSFITTDYGQAGVPKNPCGDPPVPVGGSQTPPTAEGGALRSQDMLTAGDPATLDGSIIRVDPDTGAALPDNPKAASPDPNARRIVATGLRNPYRFTTRPGTNELWVGDVGWNTWEEIDRVVDPKVSVANFGWPCYEGNGPQPGYQALNLNLCNTLYQSARATAPYYTYNHSASVVPGDGCPVGGSSVSGGAFYNGGSFPGPVGTYPIRYDGALFFADYTRRCIWAMLKGANGVPDPTRVEAFAAGTAGVYSPVDLEVGPGGDLYYVDLVGGTIRRIRYYPGNRPPIAVLHASTTNGTVPLTVNFDASASTDADSDPLTYAWDLDGDGVFTDSTAPSPSYAYTSAGTRTVAVRVTDPLGASDTATVTISVGNTPPVAMIATPTPNLTWRVGDAIAFSGSATDTQDGPLPASALTWTLELKHCPTVDSCHTHPVQNFPGVASGSFVAADHDYPSHLRLSLTARDSGGLTQTTFVDLYPQTSTLTLVSNPPGASLALGSGTATAPFGATVVTGSRQSISAPDQLIGGRAYHFSNWSDGGAQSHDVVVAADTSLTASFVAVPP